MLLVLYSFTPLLVRKGTFWLHLWDGTAGVCLNVHRAQSDEHGCRISRLCGQCSRLLSIADGDPVHLVRDDQSTVSCCHVTITIRYKVLAVCAQYNSSICQLYLLPCHQKS